MMTNDQINLEICCNTEWLRENAGLRLDAIRDGAEDDAADQLSDLLLDCLGDAGYQVDAARGQRAAYHGWNGANTFAHKLGPVGTFDALTAEQIAEIEGHVSAAVAAIHDAFVADPT